MITAFASLFCVLVAFILLRWSRSSRRSKPLPPGPRGLPILGNALAIPPAHSWMFYTELQKSYGDLLYLSALGQPIVVLNSFEAANHLLIQRASIYSDRPQLIMAGELMGWDKTVPVSPYNANWRVQRKIWGQLMNKNAVKKFSGIAEKESRMFVSRIMDNPLDFFQNVHLTAAKLIIGITYGLEIESTDHEYVRLAEEAAAMVTQAAFPGNFLVDIVPSLKYLPAWFPGATGFNKFAARGRDVTRRAMWLPFEQVEREMAAGTAKPSFTLQLLESITAGDMADLPELPWLGGAMYTAAMDTTVVTIRCFILAMTLFPDAQRKAQEEIDRVIGQERLPDIEDKENLPYIECVMKELYRWRPAAPLALPHRVTENDEYKGYHIPKGSFVLANTWAISQDCLEPDTFLPERFLPKNDKDATPGPELMDPRAYAFGYGRRVCPGLHFAEQAVFMAVASLLATTTISKVIDKEGKTIEPVAAFGGHVVSRLEPFECDIKARSSEAAALIRAFSVSTAV